MNYAIPQYLRLLNKLELLRTAFGTNTQLGKACTSAYDKMDEYYKMIKKQNFAIVATICDPRFNFNVFQNLWQDLDGNAYRNRVQKQFIDTFAQYELREKALQAAVQDEITANINDDIAIHLDLDSEDDLFKPRGIPDFEAEYTKWMKQPVMKRETEILRYWASKEYEFPTIARMARDHLAIPATSAPSECVFSVGGDIITKKRNRLGADNTRRLLCLRDWGVLEEGEDGLDGSDIEADELDCWE
jgi:hypothetical protein